MRVAFLLPYDYLARVDYERLGDGKAWRAFVEERLTPPQRVELDNRWKGSAAFRSAAGVTVRRGRVVYTRTPREIELAGRAWKLLVLRLSVEVKAGGLVLIRNPDEPWWEARAYSTWRSISYPRGPGQRAGRAEKFDVSEVRFRARDRFPWGWEPQFEACLTALELRTAGRVPKAYLEAPTDLPEPGRSPKTKTYQRILRAYEALAAEGTRAPAKELAERWGVEHSTMKTWLRRARKYVGEAGRES